MNQFNNQKKELMNDQDFDQFFKSNLAETEVTPAPSNWDKINRWSPFAFVYSFSKSNTLKVAATLLFVLSATTIYFQFQSSTQPKPIASVIPELTVQEKVVPVIAFEETKQNDFVLDIEDEKIDDDVRKEIIEKEIDDYLAFLFEDEDEFASEIDSIEISKSLELATQLPIEEMFAFIPELLDQEEYTILAPLETKITLPHRFVEVGENVEDYLLIYESNQLSVD